MFKKIRKIFKGKEEKYKEERDPISAILYSDIYLQINKYHDDLSSVFSEIKNKARVNSEFCFDVTDKISKLKETAEKQLSDESAYVFSLLEESFDQDADDLTKIQEEIKKSKKALKSCLLFSRKYLERDSYTRNKDSLEKDIDKILKTLYTRSVFYQDFVFLSYEQKISK